MTSSGSTYNTADSVTCVGLTVGADAQGGSALPIEVEWPGGWEAQPGIWLRGRLIRMSGLYTLLQLWRRLGF